MRLVSLHNSLLLLQNALSATTVAVKLVPHAQPPWSPSEVAVGNTASLPASWQEGCTPTVEQSGTSGALFELPNLTHYQLSPDLHLWQVEITDELLSAVPNTFRHSEQRRAASTQLGSLWLVATMETSENMLRHAPALEMFLGIAAQTLWSLYRHAVVLHDPVTGLAGAAEFRLHLQQRQAALREPDSGAVLMLVGLRDYSDARYTLGQSGLEHLLHEAAKTLQQILRKTDDLFYYREGQYAILATVQDREAGNFFAHKVIEQLNDAFEQPTPGWFAAGYLHLEDQGDDDDQVDWLCLKAEQALDRARLSTLSEPLLGGGAGQDEPIVPVTPNTFPATDPLREHRNHRLLWQTASLCAKPADGQQLCRRFAQMLEDALPHHTATLLALEDNRLTDITDSARAPMTRLQQEFTQRAISETCTLIHEGQEHSWFAAPVQFNREVFACLFITTNQAFDIADQMLFQTLVDQLGSAIAHQNEQTIPSALEPRAPAAFPEQGQINVHQVAQSAVMQQLLEFVGRIATTDVSVLITGESGAGKEVMAHTIHQQSLRRSAPFVTVDCGAIAHTLIDSELFGRVKGAFTGADDASEGRIAQAHGGTLFLDEIGELPLDVQSKLLRFVQEHEITAVGATQSRHIDARIICATNRNLRAEVEAGRFRGDLYYRLQIIEIAVPPLRARKDDLHQLVEHLLAKLCHQYGRANKRLTTTAWDKMFNYAWPGNVRELQNTLTRALLITDGDYIDADALQVHDRADPHSPTQTEPVLIQPVVASASVASTPGTDAIEHTISEDNQRDPWLMLSMMMRQQIEQASQGPLEHTPLGRWLNDLVVITAYQHCHGVLRDAAALLDMAESTLRRQLTKAQQNQRNPLHITSATWTAQLPALQQELSRLFSMKDQDDALASRIEYLLMQQVVRLLPGKTSAGAMLMGITPATFTKRLRAYGLDADQQTDKTPSLNASIGQ